MQDMTTAAELLNIDRDELFSVLREHKILDRYNRPFRRYKISGWFEIEEIPFVDPEGNYTVKHKIIIHQEGLNNIRRILTILGYQPPSFKESK